VWMTRRGHIWQALVHGPIFAFAVLSIVPLAERLGFATEEVAEHTNETIGGRAVQVDPRSPRLVSAL
jgi:Ca2+/H+ antiporter